jgi:hypothetical protein
MLRLGHIFRIPSWFLAKLYLHVPAYRQVSRSLPFRLRSEVVSSVLEVPNALIMALALAVSSAGGESQLASMPVTYAVASTTVSDQREPPSRNPFGFDDQQWLAAMHRQGASIGQGRLSARIFKTSSGRYYVPVESERQEIAALRDDVVAAGQLTHLQSVSAFKVMQQRLSRAPAFAEILAAHVLGVDDALRLVSLVASAPNAPAAVTFPAAASVQPKLFYAGARPRSAFEVMTELIAAVQRDGADRARVTGVARHSPRTELRQSTAAVREDGNRSRARAGMALAGARN